MDYSYHHWISLLEKGIPEDRRTPMDQLVLLLSCRKAVLQLPHTIPLAGHMGRDNTAKRIQQRYYWPTLFKDVADFYKKCPQCQKATTHRQKRVPMVAFSIMKEPFDRIAMGIVGPLCDYDSQRQFPYGI